MIYVMQIHNHKATIFKKTKNITKAQEFIEQLKAQNIRTYYVERKGN